MADHDPTSLHVCFVCSGNICRSPMAALIFAGHLERAGLADQVQVSSAGIGPWHVGEPADPRVVQLLKGHHYGAEHLAAQVGTEHLSADLLLAMDAGHEAALRDLLAHQGDTPERVRMFRSFDPGAGDDLDVPDPYYGNDAGFTDVMRMIEAAVPGLLAWVRERLGR
ncbi:low molecular weight protein-tyrosine-phosphatase [Actinophytocola xanthii]|uniref:low molecular weight protein-tyrosine-phosphatase n=1 Tax=Actinophytocola xanthii TaxID=1912961 RepID=UPI000AA1E81E|nr:low molecular weight protein-tyrosine-phosphatase [Actinophytocola xanthii]